MSFFWFCVVAVLMMVSGILKGIGAVMTDNEKRRRQQQNR